MKTVLGCVFVLAALAGASQTPPPDCQNANTQTEMNQCAAEAFRRADRELNDTYSAIIKKLHAAPLSKLRVAQRAWIQYRDANCDAATALYEGGSIAPMTHSLCLERITKSRTRELHAIYDTGDR
jgi:uncharacterized protein YecT (DUF1311 family)